MSGYTSISLFNPSYVSIMHMLASVTVQIHYAIVLPEKWRLDLLELLPPPPPSIN